jgi:predicted GNAT family acetyltransferase
MEADVTAPEGAAPAVTRNAEDHRFEATVDGQTSVLAYREAGGRVALLHTEVPPALRGRRIADALARAALDDARRRGLQVRPLCPFVQAFMRRHPEYAHLAAPGTPTGESR